MMNIQIEIEKSLLSSIFFNEENIYEIQKIIQSDDFYNPAHREIFEAIEALHKEGLPIDEEFVRQKIRNDRVVTDSIMIDILSKKAITNHIEYAKEIKKNSLKMKIQLVATKLKNNFDHKLIDELVVFNNQLSCIDNIKKLKYRDSHTSNLFDKFDIDYDEIENVKFEYLFDNFIVKNEITMISARPASGKSLISVAIANHLLINKLVDEVFYLDADNSVATIKQRNIHYLKKLHMTKMHYFVNLSKSEMMQIIKSLQKLDLTNKFIVVDSIKHIIEGDRDKNKDVSQAMEILKSLRKNGATILFLHHQNKQNSLNFESDFAGSSAFAEDTTNAFTLKRNDDKNAFIFKPCKARTGDLCELAFSYSSADHLLTKLDLSFAKQTKVDDEMINETIDFIVKSRNEPTWSDLYRNLLAQGFEKNKASKVIKDNENKIWRSRKGSRNNQKLYSLIDQQNKSDEPCERTFDDNSEHLTTISSGSRFGGVSGLSCAKLITPISVDYNNTNNYARDREKKIIGGIL